MNHRLRVMIMMQSAWTPEVYHKCEAPERAAIRNIIVDNPCCDFVLVAGGQRYEHFEEGRVVFYNLRARAGNKIEFLQTTFLRFALPLFMKPAVVVDIGGPTSLIPSGIASFFTRAKFVSVVIGSVRYSLLILPSGIRKICQLLSKLCFKKAYSILAISESAKNEIISDYKVTRDKIFFYRYKISKIFNPYVSKDLKARFNPNGPIVLTVARISPEKGLHYLVEASRMIVKKVPNVKFVIQPYSSEEKYKNYLLTMIGKYNLESYFIISTKEVPHSEMPRYMVVADVFALPSLSEGSPMVILEAMACGVPVVASKVGGIPEMLTDGYNGLLVDPGDAERLANSIIALLLNEELRKKLSKGALTTTEKFQKNEFESLLKKFIFSR